MPVFIINKEEKELPSIKSLADGGSTIITETEAKKLKDDFKDKPLCHEINTKPLFEFNKLLQALADGGRQKGVAIRIGKAAGTTAFNIALEPLLYDRPEPDKPISNPAFLPIEKFFGVTSPTFTPVFTTLKERQKMDATVASLDGSGVRYALIEAGLFDVFIGSAADFTKLRFAFARDSNGKVTVVLSRLNGNTEIDSVAAGIKGIYLDEHDLIPPPFN